MSFRGLSVMAIALSAGACNALTGASDLSLGDGDGVGLPGDRTGVDGGTPGSGNDATTGDGAIDPAKDSGGTDGFAGNDGGGPFCSAFATAAFCTDFDDTGPTAGWAKQTTNGATVEISSMKYLSTPNAVRAQSGSNTAVNRIAFFSRPAANIDVSHARLSYALYVEQRPMFQEIEINGLVFDGANGPSEFYLAVDESGANIVEQYSANGGATTSTYFPIGNAIPTGQWLRVSIEVVLTGTRTLVMHVDGKEVANKPLTMTGPGVPIVRAGLTWANKDASPAVVLIDDLAFEILP